VRALEGKAITTRTLSVLYCLTVLCPVLLGGCDDDEWGDDDSAGDDDSGDDDTGDDDAGDDDAGDDDTSDDDDDDDDSGDDDDAPVDYTDATVPDFPDCDRSLNQVKFVLGDGTVLGPVDGLDSSSFANFTGQFKIQLGASDLWAAVTGNVTKMTAGVPIDFQLPAETPGNAVLQGYVGSSAVGASDPAMAVAYGMNAAVLHPSVGGQVTFDALPTSGTETTGSFHGVVQWYVGPLTPATILVGMRGCFTATLQATDG